MSSRCRFAAYITASFTDRATRRRGGAGIKIDPCRIASALWQSTHLEGAFNIPTGGETKRTIAPRNGLP